jgi:hypothetical protein
MLWKYSLLWLGLALLGVINGILRNALYSDILGELSAHQVSTIVLMILIGLYTWLFSLIWKPENAVQAFLIGLIWFILTVLFEFVFGHYVIGHPWSSLLYDYNIIQGRIWSLVLIWTLFVPLVVYKLRSLG